MRERLGQLAVSLDAGQLRLPLLLPLHSLQLLLPLARSFFGRELLLFLQLLCIIVSYFRLLS
jgi:hypothetical protein